jgi:hypothetical protein
MVRTVTPAKTPGVAIARVLRGMGLTQGPSWRKDFNILPIMGSRHNGRIGTEVNVRSTAANKLIAEKADEIEAAVAEMGWTFYVSVFYTCTKGEPWVMIHNTGKRIRHTPPQV